MSDAAVNMPFSEASANSERTGKMVLYFGIFSIIMLFAGLLSAYIITSYSELWVNIVVPRAFYISTGVIILSSVTLKLSLNASKKGDRKTTSLFLIITLILGVVFGAFQYQGWNQLLSAGSYFTGSVDNLSGTYGDDFTITYQGKELIYENNDFYFPNDELREKPLRNEIAIFGNSAGSYIYLLSFVHLLHLVGGILFFIVILLMSFLSVSKTISPKRLRLGAIYWNFVDGLWIFLFLFLLLFH
ncbi:hypothetical protein G3O08_16755 [Cryomorpha ignava]|uniref:Heme-copper oxidase subunit III family profile domain-containing protein n=1 Tax=Cryomorpha ignava TaxID=101383 RepID=A0A7K3WTY5_9FLAO|nr:hypothetical protein [Cryomorpha ignava]NEN25153.1 hypothetical protein [Cryomorpha ignava]